MILESGHWTSELLTLEPLNLQLMTYNYAYPRPMVTVDIIYINNGKILLIKRLKEPYKEYWALPGGFVDEHEDLEQAAHRELMEETNLKAETLSQFKTYGTPHRDPRGHCISVVFNTINNKEVKAIAGDDAKELAWFSLDDLPELAFDHKVIIEDYIEVRYNCRDANSESLS